MHKFNHTAALVLLGLESVVHDESNCLALVTCCYELNHLIPSHAEFADAFNKLLYVSAIVIDGEKVSLTNFGRDIINNVRRKSSVEANAGELLALVNKELSGYKLKSMCNRTVWTEAQYQQAVDHYSEYLQ